MGDTPEAEVIRLNRLIAPTLLAGQPHDPPPKS
jgi:hypothetical protein